MAVLKILFIAACCLLIGAACLGAAMGGPFMILAAPFLVLFGWFYLPLAFVAVAAVWLVYGHRWTSTRRKALLVVVCGVGGAVLMPVSCPTRGGYLERG